MTDAAGQPIEGANVTVSLIARLNSQLMDRSHDPESLNFNGSRLAPHATTDAEGRVTLGGLPGDRRLCLVLTHPRYHYTWLLAATTDQPQPEIEGFEEPPDGTLQKILMPVQAGSFTAALKPARSMEGIVLAADPVKPLPGIKVYAYTRPPAQYIDFLGAEALFAVTDSTGKFVFPDAPKTLYLITATPPDDSPYMGWAKTVALPANKSALELSINLARGFRLTGVVVHKETGKGIPGSVVLFRFKDKNTPPKPPDSEPRIRMETDHDGRFHLLVPPGKGTVMLCDLFVGGGYGFASGGSTEPETEAKLNRYTIHIMEPTP